MKTRVLILNFLLVVSPALSFAASESPNAIKEIQVSPENESVNVLSMIPFKAGEIFEPSLLDISKRLLLATEKFDHADVTWVANDSKIIIQVVPKLFFEKIVFKGDTDFDQSSAQRNCIATYESRDISQERISQVTRCLLAELQGKSYLDSQVALHPEEATLTIQVTLGQSYKIEKTIFEGVHVKDFNDKQRYLSNKQGEAFQPLKLDADTKEILKFYLSEGYYFAEVFKPSMSIDTAAKTVSLTWRVNESHRMIVDFTGDFTSREYLEKLIEREETFPSWFTEQIIDEIENDFRSQGFLSVKAKVLREMDEDGDEKIEFQVKSGKLYRLAEPEWIGVNDRKAVQSIYLSFPQLRPRSPFREADFRGTVNEDLSNLMISMGYIDLQIRGIDFVIDHEKARVRPVITLNEGDVYLIQESSVTGIPEGYQNNQEFKDLRKNLRPGNPFDKIKIDQLQIDAVRSLVKAGFLDATIARESNRTGTGLIVRERVTAGPQYRVAKILIRGAIKTNYSTLRREVLLKTGDLYDEDRIQDSISQILRLGIARSVDISVLEKNPDKSEVFVLVEVHESPRFQIEFGPGYGTLKGVRLTFRGTYANIGGTARRLSLFAQGSRRLGSSSLPADPNMMHKKAVPFVERRMTLEYFEPSLLYLPVDGRLIFTHSKSDEKKFGLFRNAFTAAVDYRFNRKLSFSTHYDIEFSDPFNIPSALNIVGQDLKTKRLTSIGEIINLDFVDDTFNPTIGSRTRFTMDFYDRRFGGEANFWQGTAKESIFVPLWTFRKGKAIGFSYAFQFGFSQPYLDTQEVPIEKRFTTGGENSVRGFGEKAINPPGFYGGDSYFSFMSELSLPLFYGIDLLGFFDGGNTFRSNKQFHPWDLRYGAGPGIRWNTPVGPLKFGYGFIVGRKTGEPTGHFYFGVGPI